MKKIAILALIAVVILSSGCIEQLPFGPEEEAPTSQGVIVSSLQPDFPEMETGENADIYMEIKNNGGIKATGVYAYVYNLGDLGVDPDSTGFNDLEPPDEAMNVPGDIDTHTWTIDTNDVDLPQGVSRTYDPKVRLMYTYHTIANKEIKLLTKDEYRRLRQKNQVPSGAGATSVTKGPLSVTISTREPVIIEDNEDTLKLFVTVNSLGAGSVFSSGANYQRVQDLSDDVLDKLKMRIEAPGTSEEEEECGVLDNTGNSFQDVDLRRGKTLTYTCELNPDSFTTMTEIPVKVVLKYGYMKDYSTSIIVRGSGEIGSP